MRRIVVCLLILLTGSSCTWNRVDGPSSVWRLKAPMNADQRLEKVKTDYVKAKAAGEDIQVIQSHLERLALLSPNHVPTLMTAAVIAYQSEDAPRTQRYLDWVLGIDPRNVEAAVLRIRLLVEQGNLSRAKSFTEEFLQIAPEQPQVWESYAAVLYMQEDYAGARQALENGMALTDGEDCVQYHLGLIAEAQEQWTAAREHYMQAAESQDRCREHALRYKGLDLNMDLDEI